MIQIFIIEFFFFKKVGHPSVDVVDNRADFDTKIRYLIRKVADQLNIDVGDRLTTGSRKIKFVINGPLLEDSMFPEGFRDFDVCHHYLQTSSHHIQSRLRKRGSKGKAKVKSTYTHTIRKMVSTFTYYARFTFRCCDLTKKIEYVTRLPVCAPKSTSGARARKYARFFSSKHIIFIFS